MKKTWAARDPVQTYRHSRAIHDDVQRLFGPCLVSILIFDGCLFLAKQYVRSKVFKV